MFAEETQLQQLGRLFCLSVRQLTLRSTPSNRAELRGIVIQSDLLCYDPLSLPTDQSEEISDLPFLSSVPPWITPHAGSNAVPRLGKSRGSILLILSALYISWDLPQRFKQRRSMTLTARVL
ncbi:hypothetical protein DTO027B5_4996 [Paecilomyces variotii]|nr:hypothetical protein DTO027B3_3630 [Paecilomyces variotii]KAJ9333262.1 hypothetical protein DTO027B5_4996 [Paecilomyces variotii]